MSMHIEILGTERFDEFTVNKIKNKMIPVKQKYERIFGAKTLEEFKIDINTKPKGKGKDLHEVIGIMKTTNGLLRASKDGWEILNVIDEIKTDLTRQMIELKEKIKAKRTYPANA